VTLCPRCARRHAHVNPTIPAPATINFILRQTQDCKPVSVPLRVIAIHPGHALLRGSSDLPGSLNGAGHSSSPIWSCSAWGLPCQPDCSVRGALLPHHFTLTGRSFEGLSGGIFSVALSVKTPLRDPPRPLAGTLPCGDRTFLSFRRTSGYPSNACHV